MPLIDRIVLLAERSVSLYGRPLCFSSCTAASSSALLTSVAPHSYAYALLAHNVPETAGILSISRCLKTTSITAADELLGSSAHSKAPEAAGKHDSSANKQEGDTYYATPSYPNTTPEDGSAGAAAAAASRSPHPSGPADTSSMNASEGRSSQQGPDRQRNADIHYPGRQEEVLQAQQTAGARSDSDATPQEKESDALNTDNVQYGGNSTPQGSSSNLSGASGTRRMMSTSSLAAAAVGNAGGGHSPGGEGAGSDPPPTESGTADAANDMVEDEHLEGGRTGGIAGAWRAMTSDFAAGGDDMTGGGSAGTVAEDQAMAINPESGLPQLKSVDDAGAADSGFGQKRDPQQAPERGGEETARQTQRSTGEMPAEAAAG